MTCCTEVTYPPPLKGKKPTNQTNKHAASGNFLPSPFLSFFLSFLPSFLPSFIHSFIVAAFYKKKCTHAK